jgi:hypothetical protein
LITLFKKRFKDKQHLLDLTILQTHQGRNESVLDYLSRLYQLATNRNISDDSVDFDNYYQFVVEHPVQYL